MQARYGFEKRDLRSSRRPPAPIVAFEAATELALEDDWPVGEIAPDLVRDVLVPSRLLASSDCLDVYREMYARRIEEMLAASHPAVREALGEDEFGELVAASLDMQPERDRDLARAGDRFVEFLAQWPGISPERREWLHELALLEQTILVVRRAPRNPMLQIDAVTSVPQNKWNDARLIPISALRVCGFRHPVHEVHAAFVAGARIVAPPRRATWIAICRQQGTVHCLALSRRAHHMLTDLIAGRSLSDAIFERFRTAADLTTQRRVYAWLRAWVSHGFFQSVQAN